jgi:hypothetical protein
VKTDIMAGVALLAIAGVFYAQRDFDRADSGRFPDVVLVVITVLAVVIVGRAIIARDADEASEGIDLRMLAAGIVLVVVWGVLVGLIGFTISGVLAFVVMATLIRRTRPKMRTLAIDTAVGTAAVVACFLIFTEVLLVPLPVSTAIGM